MDPSNPPVSQEPLHLDKSLPDFPTQLGVVLDGEEHPQQCWGNNPAPHPEAAEISGPPLKLLVPHLFWGPSIPKLNGSQVYQSPCLEAVDRRPCR